MNVRAKFKVINSKIIDYSGNPFLELRMEAVYNDGDPENAQWSKWTPCAYLNMCVTNPAVFEAFEEGKFYYIDISPVETNDKN